MVITYPLGLITEKRDEERSQNSLSDSLRTDIRDWNKDISTSLPYSPNSVFAQVFELRQQD
jgi:hypothetical protein